MLYCFMNFANQFLSFQDQINTHFDNHTNSNINKNGSIKNSVNTNNPFTYLADKTIDSAALIVKNEYVDYINLNFINNIIEDMKNCTGLYKDNINSIKINSIIDKIKLLQTRVDIEDTTNKAVADNNNSIDEKNDIINKYIQLVNERNNEANNAFPYSENNNVFPSHILDGRGNIAFTFRPNVVNSVPDKIPFVSSKIPFVAGEIPFVSDISNKMFNFDIDFFISYVNTLKNTVDSIIRRNKSNTRKLLNCLNVLNLKIDNDEIDKSSNTNINNENVITSNTVNDNRYVNNNCYVNDNCYVTDNRCVNNNCYVNETANDDCCDSDTVDNDRYVNDTVDDDCYVNDTVNDSAVNDDCVDDNCVNNNRDNDAVNNNCVDDNCDNDTVNNNCVNNNCVNDSAVNDNRVNDTVNDCCVNDVTKECANMSNYNNEINEILQLMKDQYAIRILQECIAKPFLFNKANSIKCPICADNLDVSKNTFLVFKECGHVVCQKCYMNIIPHLNCNTCSVCKTDSPTMKIYLDY